jgi:hypothetical protein
MNRKKKAVAALASVLIFSISGAGQAQAAQIAVTVGDGWHDNTWAGAVGATLSDQYTLANGSGVYIELTDGYVTGDAFRVSNNGTAIGTTTTPLTSGAEPGGVTGDLAWANLSYGWGVFALAAGPALISINTSLDCCGSGSMFVRFVSSPSRSMPGPSDALRLDAAGTTTEKSNVVSCTPGKYTFLNGGSTPQASNIQSFVYTLLVNGKAVSTLSSDNFRSVASHLFPTIAGNMAGTATLEGATWDLKGMSNYSAQCQVYATQSGGNIQSVTTAANDSVALATAAAEAAKVQMTKDMIANWNSSNEELAKKLRDNRLAGKP